MLTNIYLIHSLNLFLYVYELPLLNIHPTVNYLNHMVTNITSHLPADIAVMAIERRLQSPEELKHIRPEHLDLIARLLLLGLLSSCKTTQMNFFCSPVRYKSRITSVLKALRFDFSKLLFSTEASIFCFTSFSYKPNCSTITN